MAFQVQVLWLCRMTMTRQVMSKIQTWLVWSCGVNYSVVAAPRIPRILFKGPAIPIDRKSRSITPRVAGGMSQISNPSVQFYDWMKLKLNIFNCFFYLLFLSPRHSHVIYHVGPGCFNSGGNENYHNLHNIKDQSMMQTQNVKCSNKNKLN